MDNSPRRLKLPLPVLLLGGLALAGVAAGLVSFASTKSGPGGAQASGGPAVTVAQPVSRTITDWSEYTGQFEAVDYVEVRARVNGYLTEVHFTDGQMVAKGDPLFVIDPRPYEIALASARAKLDQAMGSKEFAKRQLSRAGELHRKEFVAESTLDQRTEESRGAGATVEAARAAVRDAELNLQFTRVTAPISGRISAKQVSIGNLVTGGPGVASPTLLTTIVSQDPIHVTFDLTEADYLVQAKRGNPVGAAVQLRLMSESGWPHEGKLDFIDNQIDKGTGTIRARAILANPEGQVPAGAFGRVRLAASAPYEALLVPDTAIVTDQSRKLVMTVKDGAIVPKPVKLGPKDGELRVVRDGIAPDDQIVINGLMRARPGAKVTAQPGKIE
ncbi:putative Co/Zn/Cd efflux system membrane fusion protein [Paramagnetospirillum magnetotacticum MS-1]|uniref:Putative Co/Zn/Cd efflux system membrane fusion protein n=1 Tax=Paramagnetospirillum magnetotacticum MS-1 TaxID=272627 RepID=A0A0C2Z186_PARME|nr:efflux RND transporter periplasmic adaptor subunit [Paramagnetospirillum magnetotacticum]KIM00651.1 putative Co/Zn/Cd efflux system membrane fusion protein [Paramagnetospirillum magnetotacticum MS-1]